MSYGFGEINKRAAFAIPFLVEPLLGPNTEACGAGSLILKHEV